MKKAETCFNCGKEIYTHKCPHCGYEDTTGDICPRKKGLLCMMTKKLCKAKDWRECEVLRNND